MAVDLYQIYKTFYARSYYSLTHGDPHERWANREEATQISYEIVRRLYFSNDQKSLKVATQAALGLAKKLHQIEKKDRKVRRVMSLEIIDALETGNYIIEVPYPIRIKWDHQGIKGAIYVCTSSTKPGFCKIGATTIDLEKRLNLYCYKYGYPLDLYFSANVSTPFELESALASKFAASRVAGNTQGDSNEWYNVSPDDVLAEIRRWRRENR